MTREPRGEIRAGDLIVTRKPTTTRSKQHHSWGYDQFWGEKFSQGALQSEWKRKLPSVCITVVLKPQSLVSSNVISYTRLATGRGGIRRQAQTFDVCLILHQDHVTMQLARHLPVREYADIIAALQVLFRQVDGVSVTNPTDLNEEVQELLCVLLRPLTRLGIDPGMLMASYQRARIAALDGENRVPDY